MKRLRTFVSLFLVCAAPPALAQWSNAGGNEGRNGRSAEIGPEAAETIWDTAPSSVIAWQPVIEGRRVYAVRQTGFPPEPSSNESPIICFDLDTGAELFRIEIPFVDGDWTTWIAGVKGGKLYAARSGNGTTSVGPLWCYDATDGSFLWTSTDTTTAGFYDGVVFAPSGDPVVADFRNITRFDADTGATVWRTPRTCSVTGSCGPAIGNGAVYTVDAVPGGHAVCRYNLTTGAFEYDSSVMTGFTLQNTPMVAPDGTIYVPRSQNNASTDFFYAFDDTGADIVERWSVPTQWTTSSELAVGPDDSVYHVAPGRLVTRLDPATGSVIDQAAAPLDFDGSGLSPRIATDAAGKVFVTNGAFANGRLYSYNADLSLRWSDPVTNINIGGPALGPDGTLIIAGVGSDMRAYRTGLCLPDVNGDGVLTPTDFTAWINAFNNNLQGCDQNSDGSCSPTDFTAWIANYNAGC